MELKPALAIVFVFIGCCSNVVFLELLVKEDPSSGNIITFSQFLLIALQGFIFTSNCGTKKPRIGIKDYSILVVMFFVASVCNNYAFNFNIPMPLHMIFRAGSLIANMLMGVIILKKRYTISKYLAVLMITAGIVTCTVVSGKEVKATHPVGKENLQTSDLEVFIWWTVGIVLLTVALFVSARMGIYQETLYARYGKHPREALFYTHLLPLPGFLLIFNDIYEHIISMSQSEPMLVPVIGITLPKMILYLAGNVLTQIFAVVKCFQPIVCGHLQQLTPGTGTLGVLYVCISSVYVLTTECSSLTVTLVVTLRKFTSLLFSIVYFKNKFTVAHWIGTGLVFFGTLIFTELLGKTKHSMIGPSKVKKIQ